MTHSNLLRVFSYLGLRASRKNPGTNSIAVFPSPIPVVSPQCRIQLVDIWSTLSQPPNYTKGDSRYSLLVVARRGACLPMGQANSFVRGYSGTDDENACSGKSKEGADSAIPSNDVNGSVESQDEQKASADEVANIESIPEVVVSPEQVLTSQLDKKLETDFSLDRKNSKPPETEVVKKDLEEKEVEKKAQTVLNLELELGEPPERPLPGDCCGQGCDVCVWDTYNDELRDYLARKKSLLAKSK